ncbi:MAG: cobalt transporter CbiM [Deltaproteobacteria bacterium]|nr:cobalt transporter CbiM [Deltaproteobacteria bacterium]
MHIPDGYLSPSTCAVMYTASAPFWYWSAKKVKENLTGKMVPLLSIFSAFSFVIMMFNVPVPGGTTAHAVGGTLMAIVLGPWAATIGVSIALLVQAIFFGDGGILALGANCFNMAIVLPFVGYFIYRAVGRNAAAGSTRHWLAIALGSYAGINAAALCAAIELGIQPLLFHTAAGTPLYCPYSLSQTIPAMMLAHLTIAGIAEVVATEGVLAFARRSIPLWQQPGFKGEEVRS